MGLGSTLVLRRKFDPEDTLSAIAQHECTALVVVPVMLQRILELPRRDDRHATTSRRCASSPPAAARCPASSRNKVMDRFGDVLYNLYGSTEVAWATIATPEDLRAAPGTAGRPPRGTMVKLLDEEGDEVAPTARPGGSSSATRCPSRATPAAAARRVIDGLMSTGDVGHFDAGGRLFIDGRDDEMIVSGGENVFPREVEDLLARPRGDRRGRGHRRRRRAVRPAPEGVRRRSTGGAKRRRRRAQGPTSRRTSRATRSRARSCSSTSCRATRPARSSSASSPSAGTPTVALVAVAALVAAVVQAATGLGFALVLSPAVFALLEPESAVVAITVLGLALNGLVLFAERRRRRWRGARSARSSSRRCRGRSAACSCCARCRSGAADRGRRGRHRRRRPAGRARATRRADAGDPRARLALGFATGTLSTSAASTARRCAVVGPPRARARRDPRLAERGLPRPGDHRRR